MSKNVDFCEFHVCGVRAMLGMHDVPSGEQDSLLSRKSIIHVSLSLSFRCIMRVITVQLVLVRILAARSLYSR